MNQWVEVISGLKLNDTIVTKGFQGLAKAKTVKIIDKNAKTKATNNIKKNNHN